MADVKSFVKGQVELAWKQHSAQQTLDEACMRFVQDNTPENRAAVDRAFDQVWKEVANATSKIIPWNIGEMIVNAILGRLIDSWNAILDRENGQLHEDLVKLGLRKAGEEQRNKCAQQSDKYRETQEAGSQTRRDPLILDLDSNGLATTNAATNGIHFDHDANGFAEATGWLNPADAFLVVDRNGNGTIDSGLELFGDQTLLRSGAKAASGLQALAEWDSNRDGQITAADTRFTDLRVWQDLNQDGISQSTELQTLPDAGIAAISLAGTATHTAADANGNTVTRTGTFTRTDGISGLSGELAFKRDTALSIPTATYTVTDAIAAQPDLSGYGNLLDLHQALAKEDADLVAAGGTAGSGPLAIALTAYITASGVGAGDTAIRDAALDTLLYTWANAAGIPPASRGSAMDARQIAFLEAA
ncbi:MAG: hypothetical protein HZB40_21310, partial [Rhodocyclales bacterium]|nr:hypothetical protein [Rhodocyclales bacterium]